MKTIKIKFSKYNAEKVGVLLYSLDMQVLATWCIEDFLGDMHIFCICKLNNENDTIPQSLQVEKIREQKCITQF